MRVVIRLLLVLGLIWCGMHLAEPAQAHGAQSGFAQLLDANCCDEGGDNERQPHQHHHHCPIAADPNIHPGNDATQLAATAPLFVRPTPALDSLTRAPPLHPPLA